MCNNTVSHSIATRVIITCQSPLGRTGGGPGGGPGAASLRLFFVNGGGEGDLEREERDGDGDDLRRR